MKKIWILVILVYTVSIDIKADTLPDSLRYKDDLRILITDSGLGGVSVAAYLEEYFRDSGYYKNVDLIFANALYSRNITYNAMENRDQKIKVFNSALNGFYQAYRPDIIIVACNTLSVLIEETEFRKRNIIPIISIVEYGAELMGGYLSDNEKNSLIILGTETTIGEDTHRKILLESGFSNDRITTQAYPDLASEIQLDPESDMVETMIEMYTMECFDKTGTLPENIAIGLCCTHYPYSSSYFQSIFNEIYQTDIHVLDPNKYLQSALFSNMKKRFKKTEISCLVVSRAEILDSEITSISQILRVNSEKCATSLQHYQRDQGLFQIENIKTRNE